MVELMIWLACLASWLLTLVLFVLRILGVIQWAWILIASPVIIFYAITVVLYVLIRLAEVIQDLWGWRKK